VPTLFPGKLRRGELLQNDGRVNGVCRLCG
jgi:hypothetical protein